MTGRVAAIGFTGAAAMGVGVLLRWPELIAIGVGVLMILVMPYLLRRPSSAQWTDMSAPVRVVRGDEAAVVVDVVVADGSTRWVSAVDDAESDRVFLPSADRSATLVWPVDTSRRGRFLVGPSRLEAADPFGLSRRVLADREPSAVLVVPRIHHVNAVVPRAFADDGDDGERTGSETFHSLREYVVGDPQKLVHWRSSAKAGKLMVRRMVDTTVPWLLVVLDVNARAYDREGALFEDFDSPAFEATVDTAASWAWHGCGPDQRVLLTTTSLLPSPSNLAAEVTARTRESALDWLAVVEPLAPDGAGPGRVDALARRHGVGRVVLVTGRRLETSAAWVAGWRRRRPVTVVVGHS